MYNKAMNEEEKAEYKIPWDMPPEIFWDYRSDDAEENRLRWAIGNTKLTLQEIQHKMTFTNRALAKVGLLTTVQHSGAEKNFLG